MTAVSHSYLRGRFVEACTAMGAPNLACDYRTAPAHDGSPHVEIASGVLSYVVTERGEELERRHTVDSDELLYWLVSNVAFWMACEFELKYRIAGRDSRRLIFAKEIELLGKVKARWAERKRRELDAILEEHPYNDKPEG